jgi:hypothetical protein
MRTNIPYYHKYFPDKYILFGIKADRETTNKIRFGKIHF